MDPIKLNILCEFSPGGSETVRFGWRNAFLSLPNAYEDSDIAVNWSWWNPQRESAYDICNRVFSPEVSRTSHNIILATTYADKGLFKYILTHKHLQDSPSFSLGLFAFANGYLKDELDLKKYPIPFASSEEIERMEILKDSIGKPDFVFMHLTEKYVEPLLGRWRDVGLTPLGILNAADILAYRHSQELFNPNLAADTSFVGGFWPYKGKKLQEWLIPLFHGFSHSDWKLDGLPFRRSARIYGGSSWPTPHHLGIVTARQELEIYNSSILCPNISEPHSTTYGFDIVERPFKLALCGCDVISDYVTEMDEVFSDTQGLALTTAKTPAAFSSLFYSLLRESKTNPEKRQKRIARLKNCVIAKHTYHDRISQMVENFSLPPEVKERCLQAIHKAKESILLRFHQE